MLGVGTEHILHPFVYEFSVLQLESWFPGVRTLLWDPSCQVTPRTCPQAGGQGALPVKTVVWELQESWAMSSCHCGKTQGRVAGVERVEKTKRLFLRQALGEHQCPEGWPPG